MKKILLLSITILTLIACSKETKKMKTINKEIPLAISKVFQKHGGIDKWNELNQLTFIKGNETHAIDLHSRKSLITSVSYKLGFDGENVWLQQKDSMSFKGNKDFYYNLYFYFYAMPFVLADDGIIYEKTDDLIFEGKNYPGFKISFKSNIGSSPDDNYYVYYNSKTYQMEWLQYSVTFFSKKPSTKVNTIRYNDWIDVNGFLLPNSLTWYKKDENGNVSEPARSPTIFTNQNVSTKKLDENIFYKPKE
ncbi:DUF6503 family protein [Polaribacter ponticola]|uniref:DUF6503 family protein n=1 Tax=Polaribacter ponticola TaxID=2978475 RepID=A0ABT5S4T3_9FLAO|nr:DUF6503 family protein [Polaribacter sp. MSW5]MDD7913117.1 DUF6503 family protein [Polaribacter sp. MSW5]